MRYRLIVLLLFTFTVLVTPLMALEPPLGKVLDLTGRVTVTRAGETSNLSTGDQIFTGDLIEVTRNSTAKIEFGQGHQLKLAAGTQIRISPSMSSFNIDCYWGRMLAGIVADRDDSGIRVTTPTATGAVRGTVFATTVAEDGATTYQLLEGSLAATGADEGEELLLTEETKVTLDADGNPSDIEPLTKEEITELTTWAGGMLALAGVAVGISVGAEVAATGALTTITTGTGATAGAGAATFPWVIIGTVAGVAATAAVVYYFVEDDPVDGDSFIHIEIDW